MITLVDVPPCERLIARDLRPIVPSHASGVLVVTDDRRVDLRPRQLPADYLGGNETEQPLQPPRVDPPPEAVSDSRPNAKHRVFIIHIANCV